ncbi:glycosyltransferase [Methylobacterium pseudosasicola]|uniref:Lipopolysaccharide biosynthesis protein, LPS:glycosyltransferase n=1 Tax=Methylobacterium pseudosasicola TaxID=582667 RepID=A0A1I4HHK9_9HYPH|nr:glycosyltransferase [Methylobacterium pseudosasicola]SFL40876.1 Lipopolysaccharide biosynthesis protein, LPS:glycosyltransferase [Methylobacterium pseudosasicola]
MPADPARIDVALGFDGTYAPHAAAVVASAVRGAPGARFRFIVLNAGLEASLQARFQALAPSAEFVWVPVGTDDVPSFQDRGHFSRATLFRLALESLAPKDCSRVIYLDTDIVVLGDLRDLWNLDLKDDVLGAVHDENEDPTDFTSRWQLPTGGYFNAGVLLIDLERVRAESLFNIAITFYAQNAEVLPWNDQDALNWICAGRWHALDTAWNVQRCTAISVGAGQPALNGQRPRIVHFTGSQKPWLAGTYHPWSWLYWRALSGTSFFEQARHAGNVGRGEHLRLRFRLLRRTPGTLRQSNLLAADGRLDVSLVIATRNRARQLAACLDAIGRLTFDGTFEVIVVDNGSTDDTAAVVASAAARGKTIESNANPAFERGANLELEDVAHPRSVEPGCQGPVSVRRIYHARPGLGGARNAGLATAQGRIIAFTDDDCYVASDFLTEASRGFADPRIGCISGRVELFDPTDAPVTINRSRTPRRYLATAGAYLHCDGIIGGNLAFRRATLRAIGGFDATMGAGTPFAAEDVDAAARAVGAGWDGAYHPSMVVFHHHGRKVSDIPKLYKSYDIGRGAYTVKYLLRGELLAFAKGVAAVRWRIGPPWRWRRSSFTTPAWELYGAVHYVLAHLASFARRRFGAGHAFD